MSSVAAEQKDFASFLSRLIEARMDDLETTIVCTIESFDQERMQASVRPVPARVDRDGENAAYPVLAKIPVMAPALGKGFYVRPQYERGDLVLVAFSLRDVYGPLRGASVGSQGGPTLHNAVVLGGLARTDSAAPDAWSQDGLLIGHEDGDIYCKLTSDKLRIQFSATDWVEFGTGFGIKVSIGGVAYNWLHQHPTATPGPPSQQTPA